MDVDLPECKIGHRHGQGSGLEHGMLWAWARACAWCEHGLGRGHVYEQDIDIDIDIKIYTDMYLDMDMDMQMKINGGGGEIKIETKMKINTFKRNISTSDIGLKRPMSDVRHRRHKVQCWCPPMHCTVLTKTKNLPYCALYCHTLCTVCFSSP